MYLACGIFLLTESLLFRLKRFEVNFVLWKGEGGSTAFGQVMQAMQTLHGAPQQKLCSSQLT